MRDVIMSTVLKQVFQTHSSVAYIGGKSPAEVASTLKEHFSTFGEPAVCISVQRPSVDAHRVCRDHGALVLPNPNPNPDPDPNPNPNPDPNPNPNPNPDPDPNPDPNPNPDPDHPRTAPR